MVSRLLFALISASLLAVGIAFLRGGYYSSKHGLVLDFGEFNVLVGTALLLLAAVILILGVIRKPRYKEPPAKTHGSRSHGSHGSGSGL
jgi:hypothetical protein